MNQIRGDIVTVFPKQPFEALPEYLAISDLVVIPQRKTSSSYGQVPAKIFDAMAMAKPIIASRLYDISEILDGCGWLIEPENKDILADTIKYVLLHPEEAQNIGIKGRKKVMKQYLWDALREELVQVFKSI